MSDLPMVRGATLVVAFLLAGVAVLGCGGGGRAGGGAADGAAGSPDHRADETAGTDIGAPDAGGDGAAPEPTALPVGAWTWVPVAGSRCGNGTPAGMGMNVPARRETLLVYLFGGGACWDAATCFVVKSAARIDETYTTASFNADVGALAGSGLFDRADATNPFSQAGWVFVPYCTGDLHFGRSERVYNPAEPARVVHHRGGDNMDLFLRQLAVDFPAVRTIWLAGSSAGGYGATFNLDRVAAVFPSAAVHLLADSAQMITPGQGRWPVMRDAWALQFPAGCAGCEAGLPPVVDYLAARHPMRRLALLAFDQDQTIGTFWGYSAAEVQAQTNALLAAQYARANTKYLLVTGTAHVFLGAYKTLVTPGGVSLRSWVNGWATGDPAWASVR